jgi:hypothetical protein
VPSGSIAVRAILPLGKTRVRRKPAGLPANRVCNYRQVVSRKDAERYWNLFRNAEERSAAEAAASKVLPIPTA